MIHPTRRMNAMATIQNCDVRMRARIRARVAAKFEFAGSASVFSGMDILFVAEEKKRSKSDARVAGRTIGTNRS
jgi:hypothetical protein